MSGRDKMMSFDEHELMKERKKKHLEHNKEDEIDDLKHLHNQPKKHKKSKLHHRLTDFDSEEWYE